MIDFNSLKDILQNNNSFLFTTHVNPDADAIGSEIALYQVLKQLGKNIKIVNTSETPYNLTFLDKDNIVERFDEVKHKNIFNETDVIVALDLNRENRIVRMAEAFSKSNKLKICIDHHQDPENKFNHFFTDENYSATGQIIYDLIKKTGLAELTYKIAEPIYAAIMTDTGSFRFERTTPELHHIAAELIQLGVIPGKIFDSIYDQSHFSKVKLLGKALDSMQLFGDTKEISYMMLPREMFESTGALESDTDGFVNFCLAVMNVKIGILFIELKNGFKVSFRSKGNIPMNKLAGEFGGGGHVNASGARFFNKNLINYKDEILNKSLEYLEKHKS